MGKMEGTCQLCKQHKKFVKAHIIPKSLFKSLFKEYEAVHQVNVSDLDTKNKVQDAYFDNHLLCVDCDNSFSPFEQYFATFLKGEFSSLGVALTEVQEFIGDSVYVYNGVDHYKLRMFFLIMLWRCSISGQKDFRDVTLGEFEVWIENQLKSKKLESFDKLSVLLISLEDVDDIRTETVIMPVKASINDSSMIYILIKGWAIVYGVSDSNLPFFFDYRLTPSGQFNVIKLSHDNGVILLNKITHLNFSIKKSAIVKK